MATHNDLLLQIEDKELRTKIQSEFNRLNRTRKFSSSKTTLYTNHLYYDVNLGGAYIDLNPWEKGVLEEESRRPDFVCWLRNVQRASWALCLPYEIEGEIRGFYPDMLIVRKVDDKYVFDVLEPHGNQFKDNLAKMKSLVEYAKENPCLARVQMIRMDNIFGKPVFKRLDATKSYIKQVIPKTSTPDQFDELFKNHGEILS